MTDKDGNQTSPLPGWMFTGESAELLDATATGVWLVTTVGSQHLWDFSRSPDIYWTRLPGIGSPGLGADGQAHLLTLVEAWPRVGASTLVFFDDPDDFVMELWRVSSPVVRIEKLVQVSETSDVDE